MFDIAMSQDLILVQVLVPGNIARAASVGWPPLEQQEQLSDEGSRRGGWGDKLFKLGALGGGAFLAKKFFDRRRNRESDAESGRYRPARARSDSMTEETMSRMEDGRRPEPSYRTPLNRPPSRPPSRPQSPGSSYYYNTTYFSDNDNDRPHTARNALFGAGAFAAFKNLFKGRKVNDDDRRVDEMRRRDMEEERLARADSKRRYTGDGYPPRHRRADSLATTDISSTDMTRPPRGPLPGESTLTRDPAMSGAVDGPHSSIPPPGPIHHGAASELPDLPSSRIDPSDIAAGAAAGTALGAAHRRRSGSRRREDADSPPVSVKVKMHNDGRHVTLRRLTEEEAAASREARRRERRNSRRRAGSASSLSGNEGSYDRWRRVEQLERQQQEQMQREQEAAAAAATAGMSTAPSGSVPAFAPPPNMSHMAPPPPPHVPSSVPYGPGSIASPGTYTGTEASEDYANNRRRRRAERARARQERQHSVEFT
ncbi:hypothetical protein BBP40_006421 [Aspergillus hancockii]|nr:hypothetical protein BBP40_006421 [Aspergillus hancockii]